MLCGAFRTAPVRLVVKVGLPRSPSAALSSGSSLETWKLSGSFPVPSSRWNQLQGRGFYLQNIFYGRVSAVCLPDPFPFCLGLSAPLHFLDPLRLDGSMSLSSGHRDVGRRCVGHPRPGPKPPAGPAILLLPSPAGPLPRTSGACQAPGNRWTPELDSLHP